MNPEELEATITFIRDNHADQATITEKLNDIRQGFNTVNNSLAEKTKEYDETHAKYFESLEVNGRLNNQLSYQKPKDDEEDPEQPPKIKSVNELFKAEVL